MFRCKDCGSEYEIKPEYCDCGNNTFDEIQTTPQVPDIRKIFSIAIFVLCIILSIIPWTIKDKSPKVENSKKITKQQNSNIPDIDKIWDESTNSKIIAEIPKEISIKKEVEINKFVPQVNKPQQPAQKSAKTLTPKAINNNSNTTVKKVQPSKPQTVAQNQTQQINKIVKTPPKVVQKTAEKVVTKQTQPPKQVQKPKPVDQTPLINYKNNLRYAMLSKLNIPNISGSGDCAISFSIGSDGKLLNRNFIYKSSNKTVNDEVYYMLMRLPYFKKPPEIYKGETIKMKFYFNNGYYEISFI